MGTFRTILLGTAASVLAAGAAQAAPVFFADNGHYYEYVGIASSFDEALIAASAASYNGLQGYLATVTSQAEQDFIYNSVTVSQIWLAGTDRDVEGTWAWVAGPEAGTVFWQNGSTLTYANWNGGEPNNSGNEDFLQGNWSGSRWNDTGVGTRIGYVIEYGGLESAVPEPASWAMMIGGLAFVGGAMRRRRTAVSFA